MPCAPWVLWAVAVLVGCQNGSNKSSLFSPNSTKVPPPSTKSYGTSDGYYNNSGKSGDSSGPTFLNAESDSTNKLVSSSNESGDLAWRPAKVKGTTNPANSSDVRQATHFDNVEPNRRSLSVEPAVRITEPSGSNSRLESSPKSGAASRSSTQSAEITNLPRTSSSNLPAPRKLLIDESPSSNANRTTAGAALQWK